MVSKDDENVDRLSNNNKREKTSNNKSKKGNFSKSGSGVDCMQYIRQYLKNRDVPTRAQKVIIASWRDKTKTAYTTFIRKWILFCEKRHADPLAPSVNRLIRFLTYLFYDEKLSYASLNTARSAVSIFSLHKQDSLGSHPMVTQFLRGIFNLKPRLPKTSVTWDTGIVLKKLQQWHPAKNLDLHQLTLKLVLLFLLVTGQRGQTLWSLDVRNITLSKKEALCRIGDILKTSSVKHHQEEIKLVAYSETKSLCVVHYLNEYIIRTKKLRGGEHRLLISTRHPYRGVSRDTVSNWTKEGLKICGVDMSVFTPHSTRAASTSKAAQRITLPTILKTAGWRSASTFARFYKKPIQEGRSVADLL